MHASPQSSFGREVEPSCGACRHHTPFRRRDIQEGLQNGQGCTLFSEDEPCSSPLGSYSWPFFLTRAYGTLPTSLIFSSPNASMLAHVALPSCQTEGGYWAGERGLLSTAQVQCGKNGVFDEVFLFGYIYLYIYCYCVIQLYSYISIQVLRYLSIALLHAYSMGVLLSLYLYFILVPYFDLYFFMIVVAVSLSSGFLPCKGMAVLSDTKHQAMPYSAKTFPESLPQMLHIWVFQKTFYRIAWCSDSWNHHFFMHVKRLYDDEMTE